MKIVIIGASHAGIAAIDTIKASGEKHEIVVFDRHTDGISFISAGIMLALNEKIKTPDRTAYTNRIAVEEDTQAYFGYSVESIDTEAKVVTARDLDTGKVVTEAYDKLIYSAGSYARIPDIKGVHSPRVSFVKNTDDAMQIMDLAKRNKSAIVYGGGPVGVELAASLATKGLKVTYIMRSAGVMHGHVESRFSTAVIELLRVHKINVVTNTELAEFEEKRKGIIAHAKNGEKFEAGFAVLAVGLKPNGTLLEGKVEMSSNGTICVDEHMQTSNPDIYSAGDAAVSTNNLTKEGWFFPLMSIAVKQGKTAGYALSGHPMKMAPILFTIGVDIFSQLLSRTGLTVSAAQKEFGAADIASVDVDSALVVPFMPQVGEVMATMIYQISTGRIIGAQVFADAKLSSDLVNVFSTAISKELKVAELVTTDMYFEPSYNAPFNILNQLAEAAYVKTFEAQATEAN